MNDKKRLKNDIKLIAAALIIAVVSYVIIRTVSIYTTGDAYVLVTVDNEEIERLPLNKDTTITVKGLNGFENVLVIKDGSAYVESATCPDKICVHKGKIRYNGEAIVCLPGRVVITVISNDEGVDATVR
ncbi:MAG: NusG domain II-containing protein [Lachnospiraceae bacterium]|nr:NusG domain II-containing protein [Lachnospiraceae bacterium]